VGNRHRGRELAFQILFQMEQGGHSDLPEVFMQFLPEQKANPEAKEFARLLAGEAWPLREELDKTLAAVAENWDVKRFGSVDRALLRLGAYELLYRPDIPYEVTLNEAVELAKAYGTDESPAFVNGVLDMLRKRNPREKSGPGLKPGEVDLAAGGGPADGEEEEG
jgi:N utilization substance protein B